MATVEVVFFGHAAKSVQEQVDIAPLINISTGTLDTTAPSTRLTVPQGATIAAVYCPTDFRLKANADAGTTNSTELFPGTQKHHVGLTGVSELSAAETS